MEPRCSCVPLSCLNRKRMPANEIHWNRISIKINDLTSVSSKCESAKCKTHEINSLHIQKSCDQITDEIIYWNGIRNGYFRLKLKCAKIKNKKTNEIQTNNESIFAEQQKLWILNNKRFFRLSSGSVFFFFSFASVVLVEIRSHETHI